MNLRPKSKFHITETIAPKTIIKKPQFLNHSSYFFPDPDLKRRLNAFIQAKERGSGTPAPAPAAPTVSVAEVAPVNTVISPGSGRRLYQPRSYSNLSNGQ